MSFIATSRAEHLVGGKAAHDAFSTPQVAQLAAAACEGDIKTIDQAIKNGVDVNATGFEGVTPLLWALTCDNVMGMEALLKAGANPNQVATRFNAVYAAATRFDSRPLKLLLQYGGDPNAKDAKTGVTALREAGFLGEQGHGWDNYYALFNLKSINLNDVDDSGGTIATALCKRGQFDKLAEVLERGYSHDLADLGSLVDIVSNKMYDERQTAFLKKVRTLLEERGVKLPPAPIPTIPQPRRTQ